MPSKIDFLENSNVTSIKICGFINNQNFLECSVLPIDAMGINFYKKSKRYLSPDNFSQWETISVNQDIVGVFVNHNFEDLVTIYKNTAINAVQLHGDESSKVCKKLQNLSIPVIKAIRVKDISSLENLEQYYTPYFLLDSYSKAGFGGTGETFQWSLALNAIKMYPDYKFLLAGGITKENATKALKEVKPHSVDLASSVESSAGIKDIKAVTEITKLVKA